MPRGKAGADAQDASASNEQVQPRPATQDPAAEKLLDKAMTPNQPPPIQHDASPAEGIKAEQERQQIVQDAVKAANADVLPKLGGNTWDTEATAADEGE